MKSLLVALFSLFLFATTIKSRGGARFDWQTKEDPHVDVSDSTPRALRPRGAGEGGGRDIMKDERMGNLFVEVFDSKPKTTGSIRGQEIESVDWKNIMKEQPRWDLVVKVSDSAPKTIGRIESIEWKNMMKQERTHGGSLVDVSISTREEKAYCRENVKKPFDESNTMPKTLSHNLTRKQPFRAKQAKQIFPSTITTRK
ncbi:organ-specific protein S2-like [Pyrus ussuriensis x Pyrus communis]|uniref:Organ-specific protein S2-like n=1 Tax=Pyrus ussuriensis x Pyrus communis TaxID=2448454 RepID=A0A5N5IB17_9ROSA|nr:organ-specific protein S2-like [Pyrus ussuriensis x Pyrus communis]